MYKVKLSRAWQLLLLLLIIAITGLDQWLKWRVYEKGGFFNWREIIDIGFYRNFGTAFGIPIPYYLLLPLIILSLALISRRYYKFIQRGYLWAFISYFLILGGALSNLIDRLHYGFVIDYIHLFFGSTFNLADGMIIVGVGFLIIKEFKK